MDSKNISRRKFIKQAGVAGGSFLLLNPLQSLALSGKERKRPNVIFVFADQWRAQDTGYAGNKDVYTQNIDHLAKESVNFKNTISCMPVSTPYRASLLTGQYALTHGLFVNDVTLDPEANSIGKVYKANGYNTGYIGKWHVNGNGRSAYIPESHRQGFDHFMVLECTHDYTNSSYYDHNDVKEKKWDGYDAFAQTDEAIKYIDQNANKENPFLLFLSWGPPHNPYEVVPKKYLDLYKDKEITLRKNVPEESKEKAIRDTKGYYAHIAALDECMGQLQKAIKDRGIEENTIFVFTSDHGDMLGSQGEIAKQKPYEESILVPFLLKYPAMFGRKGKKVDTLFNSPDIMPTLLGMSGISIPGTVEGKDITPIIRGKAKDNITGTLIECITPFGEWERRKGGKEYRGVRTKRYTYVVDLEGAWLLFDNKKDPYQMKNLINKPSYATIQSELDIELKKMLKNRDDQFLVGEHYIKEWGYVVDEFGTIPYTI